MVVDMNNKIVDKYKRFDGVVEHNTRSNPAVLLVSISSLFLIFIL